jgi:multiple antibiotic resistance protein
MNLHEYILLAFSSLFVIVDPITLIPVFLAMTPKDTPQARERMARIACLVAACVLVGFAAFGNWLFRLLGITITAFQMAGSLLLLLLALDMLRARRSTVRESDEETGAGAAKEDVAVTPLGIPLLAGPGAITAVIILNQQAHDVPKHLALYGCILVVCAISYLCLRATARGMRWVSPIAMKITTRLMGLLLAAIAMQFLIDALKAIGIGRV